MNGGKVEVLVHKTHKKNRKECSPKEQYKLKSES